MKNEAQYLRSRLAAAAADAAPIISIFGVLPEARLIPLSRARHVRGFHPVRPGHPAIRYESKLEARFITQLARLPELVSIRSQPVTIRYRHEGTAYRYTPDFLVELAYVPVELARLGFGLKTYIEVKPLKHSLSTEPKLVRAFAAVRKGCHLPIALVTDWDLVTHVREVRHAG